VALAAGALGGLSSPLHERGEQVERRAVAVDQLLRAPLNAAGERSVVRELDTLDDRIGRPRHLDEPLTEPLDRLMMEAVHVDLERAQDAGEPRAVANLHLMRRDMARLALEPGLAVIERRARLARDVLVGAAPQRDRSHLQGAAN